MWPAIGTRPLFPSDRDVEDHVFCLFEFPAPGYDAKDKLKRQKKIGVQYASINGNGFGTYGEIVYGTKGALILERGAGSVDHQGTGQPPARSRRPGPAVRRWTPKPAARRPRPPRPRRRSAADTPRSWSTGRGAFATPRPRINRAATPRWRWATRWIALTANMAARQGMRIEFQPEWFEPDRDETPENVKPDVKRYNA